ncbi:MAG: ATP-dependent helicase [Planctomycetota bacterium]|nr:MAG: ATP-dependent helicase [Planctomycetota bacterium]
MKLDKDQASAVKSLRPRVLLRAAAGSGKTRTLIARAVECAKKHGPSNCLVVTFTNAAAEEAQSRIIEEVEAKTSKVVRAAVPCMTFHSWCASLVRDFGPLAGISAEFRVLDDSEAKQAKREELDRSIAQYTFDELVEVGRKVAEAVPHRIRERYKAILVDEVQDLDPGLWEILVLIDPDEIFAVGDDRQSIYGFRGADPSAMDNWAKQTKAGRLYLTRNYRSSTHIVDVANELFPDDREPMVATTTTKGKVECIPAPTIAEQKGVLQELWKGGPFTVLCRTNHHVRQVLQLAKDAGVPAVAYEQPVHDLETPAGQLLLRLFRWATWPSDWIAAYQVLTAEPFNMDRISALQFRAKAREANRSYLEEAIQPRLRFADWTDELVTLGEEEFKGTSSRLLLAVWYASRHGTQELFKSVTAAVLAYVTVVDQDGVELALGGLKSALAGAKPGPPGQLLTEFALRGRSAHVEPEDKCVVVLTAHRAKGLEWPRVALWRFDNGTWPMGKKDLKSRQGLEERRVAYVAMTRAKRELFFIHSGKPSPFMPPVLEEAKA